MPLTYREILDVFTKYDLTYLPALEQIELSIRQTNSIDVIRICSSISMKKHMEKSEILENFGKVLMKATCFMSGGSLNKTIMAITDMLTICYHDEQNVTFELGTIKIIASNIKQFKIIIICGLKSLPLNKESFQQQEYLLHTILDEIVLLLKSMFRDNFPGLLRTLLFLLKLNIDIDDVRYTEIAITIGKLMMRSTSQITTALCHKVIVLVMKKCAYSMFMNLNVQFQIEDVSRVLLNHLCYILTPLTNEQVLTITPYLVNVIAYTAVTVKDCDCYAARLYVTLLTRIPCENFQQIILDNAVIHLRQSLGDAEPIRDTTRRLMKFLLQPAIRQYGANILDRYSVVAYKHLSISVDILTEGVNSGLINVNNYKIDVENYILSQYYDVHWNTFIAMCTFKSKKFIVTSWHLKVLQLYVTFHYFDVSCVPDKTLAYLISQIFMNANYLIKEGSGLQANLEIINLYIEFIEWLYTYCCCMLALRSTEAVSIAASCFMTTVDVIVRGNARTKYKVTENYKGHNNKFFHLLMNEKKFRFYSKVGFKDLITFFVENDDFSNIIYPVITSCCLNWMTLDYSQMFTYGYEYALRAQTNQAAEKGIASIMLAIDYRKYLREDFQKEVTKIPKELLTRLNIIVATPRHKFLLEILRKPIFVLAKIVNTFHTNNYLSDNDRSIVTTVFDQLCTLIGRMLHIINENEELYYNIIAVEGAAAQKCFEFTVLNGSSLITDISLYTKRRALVVGALDVLTNIIAYSNMKRPIANATRCLRHICVQLLKPPSNIYHQTMIKYYLDQQLSFINDGPDLWYLTVRKCPQSRLTLHCLAVADPLPHKPFARYIFEFMLNVLNNHSSSEDSVMTVLNCLEVLLTDKTIRQVSSYYIERITICCLNYLGNKAWKIRNGAIQLFRAIVMLFSGQNQLSINKKGMEEIFYSHLQLTTSFYSELIEAQINSDKVEAAIGIFLIFSETRSQPTLFVDDIMKNICNIFLKLIVHFIRNVEGELGIYAAKAYTAFCLNWQIPSIISEIVQYIRLMFFKTNKNVLFNLLYLLQRLRSKYICIESSNTQRGVQQIATAFNELNDFLARHNSDPTTSVFKLMPIQVSPDNTIENTLIMDVSFDNSEWRSRVMLYNNISYYLPGMDIKNLPLVLERHLTNSSFSMQNLYLNYIVKKRSILAEDKHVAERVLKIILEQFLDGNTSTYISTYYCHVILMLVEYVKMSPMFTALLPKLRLKYSNIDNVYEASVITVILSRVINFHNDDDETVIKQILSIYKQATAFNNEEILKHVSTTLIYLYDCVETEDRYDIFSLAFTLILSQDTQHEICKFIALIYRTSCTSVYKSLERLLSFKNLRYKLQCSVTAAKFLCEKIRFMQSLKEPEDDVVFYKRQLGNSYIQKDVIIRILLMKLEKSYRYLTREECLEINNSIQQFVS